MALVAVVLAVAVGSWACSRGYSGAPESISIGSPPLESSALLYVAEDRRFFADNGLNVSVRDYDTGAAAFNGSLSGEVDIGIPAEYPLVGSAFKRETMSAIASIDKVQYFYLLGRKDRGINSASDLSGKRIGVVRKTIAEFFLGRFLTLHGIDISQVTLVDVSLSGSEDAIMNGEIDAILSRPPYVDVIEKRLGAKGVVWPAQSSQALYAVLATRNDWIAGHGEVIKRLFTSLAQAEKYVIEAPGEAKAIVQSRLKLDDAYMEAVWSQNQFSLTLDQSLVVALEDEARWMISSGITDQLEVPNFLDHIYEDPLKAVRPAAVNIIR